jgi:hypothetical protein
MPNLIGAYSGMRHRQIESNNLRSDHQPVESDLPEGTIIWQSVPAYTEVEEHTKIYLQVSIGTQGDEEPSPRLRTSRCNTDGTAHPVGARNSPNAGTGHRRRGMIWLREL